MQDFCRDLEYIKSRFSYNPETGVLIWKPCYSYPAWWNTKYAGKQPTAKDKLGYMRAKITRIVDGVKFSSYVSCHRICFFIHNGWLPEVVDHIDGDVSNNRASNLRAADMEKNSWNRNGNKCAEVGFKGVYVSRYRKGKMKGEIYGYIGTVGHKGKKIYLGVFATAEAAGEAVRLKEEELRSEWVRCQKT